MKATITFTCQPMSYKGDLDDLYPDFGTNYQTTVGFRWTPCAVGPEGWDLTINIIAIAALVGKGFLEELTKDLYQWTKTKLLAVLQKKRNNEGTVQIQFEDIAIIYYTSFPNEDLTGFIVALPDMLDTIDPALCELWMVKTSDMGKMIPEPNFKSVAERIRERTGADPAPEQVYYTIDQWESRSSVPETRTYPE